MQSPWPYYKAMAKSNLVKIPGQQTETVTRSVSVFISVYLLQIGVVGQFVEFFGPGVAALSIADRATIANMCPG